MADRKRPRAADRLVYHRESFSYTYLNIIIQNISPPRDTRKEKERERETLVCTSRRREDDSRLLSRLLATGYVNEKEERSLDGRLAATRRVRN